MANGPSRPSNSQRRRHKVSFQIVGAHDCTSRSGAISVTASAMVSRTKQGPSIPHASADRASVQIINLLWSGGELRSIAWCGGMTVKRIRRFEPYEIYRENPKLIAEYLNAALGQGHSSTFVRATRDMIRAQGGSHFSRKSELGRESLYRSFTKSYAHHACFLQPRYFRQLCLQKQQSLSRESATMLKSQGARYVRGIRLGRAI